MAIYSGTATSVALQSGQPVLEFVAAGDGVRAHLIELSLNQSSGPFLFQLLRPLVAGLAAPDGTSYLQLEDDEPPTFVWSPVTITSLWKRKPSEEWTTTSVAKHRRVAIENGAFVVCWAFPRGLIIAPGYSVMLGTASAGGTVTASCVVEV